MSMKAMNSQIAVYPYLASFEDSIETFVVGDVVRCHAFGKVVCWLAMDMSVVHGERLWGCSSLSDSADMARFIKPFALLSTRI
jgi:hypothetical protein